MELNKKSNNKEIEKILAYMFADNCLKFLNMDRDNLEIKKSESPDYILYDKKIKIGLEITRSLDQNSKKANVIRDKDFKNMPYNPIAFEGINMAKGKINELLNEQKKGIIGAVYEGNSLEKNVINNILKSVQKKIKKFDKYKKYKINILLIHTEDRATLDHDYIINDLKYFSKNNIIKFNFIVLKLGFKFHFFSSNNYSFCNIHKKNRP